MDTRMRELLIRSFDAALSGKQRRELDAALASSEELRVERDRLLALRAGAAESASPGFGPYFAERVMAQVSAVGERSLAADLFTVFRPVALAATIALLVLVPFGGRTLYESLSGQEQSLVSVAQSAYALDVEEVLCQTE